METMSEVNVSETSQDNPVIVKARTRIDRQTFIDVWESCDSVDDVAATLNAKLTCVNSRASQMRKMGIPLKKFPRKSLKGTTRGPSLQDSLALLAKIRNVSIEDITKESNEILEKNN